MVNQKQRIIKENKQHCRRDLPHQCPVEGSQWNPETFCPNINLLNFRLTKNIYLYLSSLRVYFRHPGYRNGTRNAPDDDVEYYDWP